MWLVKTSLLDKHLTKKVYLCVHNKMIVQYIYILEYMVPYRWLLPRWPAVEVFPRDLICCSSNSIIAVKYHSCIKTGICHSEQKRTVHRGLCSIPGGPTIQAFGQCLVGHSCKQHINEQWSNLTGYDAWVQF